MAAVVTRYAQALADVALKEGVADVLSRELSEFAHLLRTNKELESVLTNPAVSLAQKRSLCGVLCERASYSKTLRNFLLVLIDHHRIALLDRMAEAFVRELDRRRGAVQAEIATTVPLDDPQRERMTSQLSAFTHQQVRASFKLDPSLIGGVRVRIGSVIYDGSVRGYLESLRQRLTTE